MSNEKVILIDPVECVESGSFQRMKTTTSTSGTSLAVRDPIGLEYIAGYLEKNGYSTRTIQQRSLTNDELIEKILESGPLLVGFSLWSYNVNKVSKLTEEIKKRNEHIITVVGGYHPTGDPSIVRTKSIDYAVIGEGEQSLLELVKFVQNGGDKKSIDGIAYLDGDEVVINKPRERLDFSKLPWPKREPDIMTTSKISGLTYPVASKQMAAVQISYSRGCPHNCDFCPSGKLWNYKTSHREADDVVAEIKDLKNRFGTNYIYFSDLNFNLEESKVKELCQNMIDEKLDISWSAMVKVGIKSDTFDLMKNSGCSRLAYGAELLNDKSLERVKPRQNIEMIKKDLVYSDSIGIINRCFLLMGFPWESPEDHDTMLDGLKNLPIDNIRLAFVTPFPGTTCYEQWKSKIDHSLNKFTGEYPMVKSDYLKPEELVEKRKRMVRDFYSSEEYAARVKSKIMRFPYLKDSFKYFFETQLIPENNVDKMPSFLNE